MFDAALFFCLCRCSRPICPPRYASGLSRVFFNCFSSVEEDSPSVELPEYSLSSSSLFPEDSLSSEELSSFESHSVYDTFFPFSIRPLRLEDSRLFDAVSSTWDVPFPSFSNHYYLPFSNLRLSSLDYLFSCHHYQVHLPEKKYQSLVQFGLFYWLHCTCRKVAGQSKYRPATWNGGVNTLDRTLCDSVAVWSDPYHFFRYFVK